MITEQWRVAEGVWILKEENSTQIDQFYITSLLGGISGLRGCLEHTAVVTQLIREAKENMGNCQCCASTWQMHMAPFHTHFNSSLMDMTSVQSTCTELDG